VVICLEQGADLHMVQLIPLPLTVSCSSKIQIGFTFLVLAHPGCPGQRAVKWVCVCVFWYRLTRVVPEKGLLNGCVLALVVIIIFTALIFSVIIAIHSSACILL